MSSAGRILIVTPTLGRSAFLDDTVASIEALKLDVLHVLSAPAGMVAQLAARYPQARVVQDAGREGGIYGALNTALDAVKDESWSWFTYINDDDLLSPGFGEMVRAHVAGAKPEAVTYGIVRLIDEAGRQLSWITVEPWPRCIPAVLHNGISPLNQQGMLFHRKAVEKLGGFDLQYRLCADLDFWARAYAAGFPFRYYNLETGQFRIRAGQLSGDVGQTRREQAAIVEKLFPQRPARLVLAAIRLLYRLQNLPRYVRRWRSVGWRRSEEVLGST